VLDGLRGSEGLRYALTGSLAAQRLAPYATPRLAMLYVDNPTAVDLLTAPGRGPAEAQALMEWMQTHESDWRR
jgi:hypothetical protein